MKIKDIVKMQTLSSAKLIAGKCGIINEITGVNVLEAIDIANWGRHGEVILTSFFALHNLSDSELEVFFEKLHTIGISAVIIKIDRLVANIPAKIIELCDQHAIPLIQINKDIKYESIILEILGPIINTNINLLNKYYEIHSELTKLALKMPSIDEILHEFKKMISRDVSLINTTKVIEIATNQALSNATILATSDVLTEKYVHFKYERNDVLYNGANPPITGQQIRVQIPHLGYDDYELVIHELPEQVSSEDFMVIENGVKFLQMELLKKYVVSQNLFQQKNNIISDLLNDRLFEEKDINEVLDSLTINKYPHYQLMLIKLYPRDDKKNANKDHLPQALRQIRLTIKDSFKDIVFLERLDVIVFIHNFNDNNAGIAPHTIEKKMNALAQNHVLKDFHYNVSISSKVEKRNIPQANREILDTEKILRLFHNQNNILLYEDLGIYKLFLDSNNLSDLKKFISPRLANFKFQYPLLFETLHTFLDTNQNYILTSEKLFLHPKTVRYRIDKTKSILNVNFSNPEELLQIQIAGRLFKLIDGRNHNE